MRDYAPYPESSDIDLNDLSGMERCLSGSPSDVVYVFTLHKIFYEGGLFRQTRSSPNWQGGVVTMATCKHQMRTWTSPKEWVGVWNVMLCPSHCASNAIFFVGQVCEAFESNYDYGVWMRRNDVIAYRAKRASKDPRGDIYTPRHSLVGEERYEVENFLEPPGHTRSTETYRDGTPKWWKDIRYRLYNKRPAILVYNPSFLFSRPEAWTTLRLGRSLRKLVSETFLDTLAHKKSPYNRAGA